MIKLVNSLSLGTFSICVRYSNGNDFVKAVKVTSKLLQPVQAIMLFVLRYKQGEQSLLQTLNNVSTYTVDIPLNKRGRDYEGGGVRYVRYNCTVLADQIGAFYISKIITL